jgi:hypothetical protein
LTAVALDAAYNVGDRDEKVTNDLVVDIRQVSLIFVQWVVGV